MFYNTPEECSKKWCSMLQYPHDGISNRDPTQDPIRITLFKDKILMYVLNILSGSQGKIFSGSKI